MVLDDFRVAPCDENEMLDAGLPSFVDRILNQWAIDDGEHLFRHRLGGGKEPRAKTGDRKHRSSDRIRH